MADELTTKRIINLPAESAPAAGDVFVVDNETTGTKKLPVTSLIDPTPTEGSAKAVSSGGVWGQIEGIRSDIGKQDYVSLFELGGISITAEGWSYSASNTRVRTKEGTTLHLKAGVTIGLAEYSDARFYVGWHTDDGYDFNNGWKRSDYVTTVEGDYVILISTYSNTVQESANALASLFFRTDDTVYKNISGLVSRIDTTDANLETTNDNLDATNNKISRQDYCPLLELGSINFSESGWAYTNTSQRVRTRNGITLHIKAGVTVGLTDYTDARFCLGWKKSDGTYENIAMRRTDFVTTVEGDYVLLIANYTGDSEESINRLGSRFFVDSDTVYGAVADLDYADVTRWSQINTNVQSVNHRGFVNAPENSLVSYKMARKYGFTHAECDITWTSDNVIVLHHDETINRTGRNADGTAISETININDITYAEALTYDFGIYKNPVYAGLKIPKLEEFLVLCRNIGIKPYIEIKPYNITQAKIESLVDMVRRYGMEENSVYISSSPGALTFLKNYNPKASIGYVVGAINTTLIATANSLKTGTNRVFMVSSAHTPEAVEMCYSNNLPLIVWTINDVTVLRSLDPYVSGILSDMIVMGKCLYDYSIG